VKKRTGKHETTIREYRIDGGITLGQPLTEFQGILRGVPIIAGSLPGLMDE
jgi:circadian clock protein KaiC